MALLFESELTGNDKAAFLAKVVEVAKRLQIDPNWLMIVMRNESGFRADIVNKNGGATGLIQFMPRTAKGLGTSTAALAKMTRPQQMEYVYKYYKPYAGKIKGYKDLYMITFYPVALTKPLNFVLGSEISLNYARNTVAPANKPFDFNKDGVITKEDFFKYLDNKYGVDGTKAKSKQSSSKSSKNNKNTQKQVQNNTQAKGGDDTGTLNLLLLGGIIVYKNSGKSKKRKNK